MFTYVKGSSKENYELGNIISNPVGVKGLKERPGATPDDEQTYRYLYSDIRALYGISSKDGSEIEPNNAVRKEEGFWWLEYKNVGNVNAINENLEYIKLQDSNQPVITFLEEAEGEYKELTVLKTYNYVDMDIAAVKSDLKARTLSSRSDRINAGYMFNGHRYSTDLAGRQMLLNYYTQVTSGSDSVSIFLDDAIVKLSAAEMTQLYTEAFAMVESLFAECNKQCADIDAVPDADEDAIYKAQQAAVWVYEGIDIPERTR
ncbi:TPA: DUF4376 domain-containing protein [Escherichia coli]|nr:DUF4376 domain-containing protein [Escherichia coli]